MTSEIEYISDILIDGNGRSGVYMPVHDETITVDEVTYDVKEVVQFDISVSKQGSDPMPTYSLSVSVDDAANMHGAFFVSYWRNPADDSSCVDASFDPASGITLANITKQSIKFCF